MNRKLIWTLATAGLLSAAPAFAETIVLNFDGIPTADSYPSVGNYYAAQGITFQNDVVAVPENSGIFSNEPTPPNVITVLPSYDNEPTAGGLMQVTAGFTGNVSFLYSSTVATTVSIFAGLYGTGPSATINLLANAENCPAAGPTYCIFEQASTNLAFVAHSIDFATLRAGAGIDNVTINTVPLPAAAWLLMSGIGAIGAMGRRRRAASQVVAA